MPKEIGLILLPETNDPCSSRRIYVDDKKLAERNRRNAPFLPAFFIDIYM